MPPLPIIFGCAGPTLTDDERAFFRDTDPFGYILFARNIEEPQQVRKLTDELRTLTGRDDVPVLIDQEGGRVQRLRPPHWRAMPAAAAFGSLAQSNPEAGRRACWVNARLLAEDLRALGFTINCVPCLDLQMPGAHAVIGDRAFAAEPETVIALGRAQAEAMLAGAVLPVMKHMPGHGRVQVDSHERLPVVDTPVAELAQNDFLPFTRLSSLPIGMTAHVLYTALDPQRPGTLSARVNGEIIRRQFGFDGLLLSDDLDMQALSGDIADRVTGALAAGCDVVLQCNGKLASMQAAASKCPAMTAQAAARWQACARHLPDRVIDVDTAALTTELQELLQGATAKA